MFIPLLTHIPKFTMKWTDLFSLVWPVLFNFRKYFKNFILYFEDMLCIIYSLN